MSYQADHIDQEIIKLLQQDGKLKIKEIASQLGLTNTPIFDRIKRLEHFGFITGYAAQADRTKLGFHLIAFCSISFDNHQRELIEQFETDILEFSEVMECYHIAGNFDYLLKVLVKNMEEYQRFITHKLAKLTYIRKVQSSFVMTEVKKDAVFPFQGVTN